MRYKIGDKVRIKSWTNLIAEYGQMENGAIDCGPYFIPEMRQFCEEIVTIAKVITDYKGARYRMFEDHGQWLWSEAMIMGLVSDSGHNPKTSSLLRLVYNQHQSVTNTIKESTYIETNDEIVIGDEVEVIDPGQNYSTFEEWIEKFCPEYYNYFSSGDQIVNGLRGIVVTKAPHMYLSERMLCAIVVSGEWGRQVYCIGIEGVRKVL